MGVSVSVPSIDYIGGAAGGSAVGDVSRSGAVNRSFEEGSRRGAHTAAVMS